MKLEVIKIGKPAFPEYEKLVAEFAKRLSSTAKIENTVLRSASDSFTESLLSRRKGTDLLVVLDERGKMLSSPDFAQRLESWQQNPQVKTLRFLIGGPYGVEETVRKSADFLWSFSPAVFPSDLAWLMVWEQIYRAYQIQRGSPYHHL